MFRGKSFLFALFCSFPGLVIVSVPYLQEDTYATGDVSDCNLTLSKNLAIVQRTSNGSKPASEYCTNFINLSCINLNNDNPT